MKTDIEFLLEFLRFPSVSTDPVRAGDVEGCAAWLAAWLGGAGLDAEACPTEGKPVVLARTPPVAGAPTVVIYGHYDVQPASLADGWSSDPFIPIIRDGVIFCRGAADNKGQIAAHIAGVAGLLRENRMPAVNVIFLVEGEEEIGSPSLGAFLRAHREDLRCDAVLISDTGMVAPGVPTLTYGTRGIAAAELIVRGPATDLHSGIFGGAVANPGTALVRMLASLHDATGRVAVPGFYDAVRPIGGWERTAWAALPGGDDELLELTGVPALAGEAGYTGRERIWGRPTAEINGIGGGFQGEGSKTVIPRHAFAKLTFRLVPDQDPERVLAGVKAFLEAKVPPGVTMEFVPGHSGPAFSMDPASPWGVRVGRALERAFSKPVAMIREGGTIPILSELRSVLGGEILLAGLALPDCRAHGPDENFPIENFEAGVRLVREFLGVVGEG